MKITGDAAVRAKLRRMALTTPVTVAAVLYARAEGIMSRSKREFVPVDLGTLRSSGYVEKPTITLSSIRVGLSYGGPAAAYALAVHEHLSSHSPRSWRGTTVTFHPAGRGPKYLERPLMDAVSTLARDIADDIRLTNLL